MFHVNPDGGGDLAACSLYTLAECDRESHGLIFSQASKSKLNLFNKVYGCESIRRDLVKLGPDRIIASWKSNLESFRRDRMPFLLYQ